MIHPGKPRPSLSKVLATRIWTMKSLDPGKGFGMPCFDVAITVLLVAKALKASWYGTSERRVVLFEVSAKVMKCQFVFEDEERSIKEQE